MYLAINGLLSSFNELQEVLERPMMQYSVLNSFLVNIVCRKALASRISQTGKSIVEVCFYSLL